MNPRVLMIASEAAPLAKTGGLADVVGALPAALSSHGIEAAIVLPRYGSISLDGAYRIWERLEVHLGSNTIFCDVWLRERGGVRFYLIDCPWLFDRPGLYSAHGHDYGDNHLRFAAFSSAALGVQRYLYSADILHLHDWQAALVAPYVRTRFNLDPSFRHAKIVFTIHNLEHQGRFGAQVFGDLGLDSWLLQPANLEFHGDVNFMKGGVVFSDAITTVSPRYAQEIQTAEFGYGLDGLLRANTGRLHGILNGVDYGEWNPETDPHLAAHYSAADMDGKRTCKQDLLNEMHLPGDALDRPLIGIVSRFARQKGFDLFSQIADELLAQEEVMLAFVGSGERRYEDFFRHLIDAYPGKVAGWFGYNERLAHKIEAGSDIFLMPSLFEPCGLNQMYSLRYGTLPVVRATGGLDDTVDAETGFKFWGYDPRDLLKAIQYALAEYREPEIWRRRTKTAMSRDYSWAASAGRYAELYRQLLGR
ncbi:MAG: glycogen synthase GlgA [Bryobacteraceae bacterium]